MGLFSGAYKRLKKSWGNIGKNAGNAITMIGKSKIAGLLAPTGLGSVVNTALEKLGKSTYKTGQVILGEIGKDEYFDELNEINKYGAIFGPYNVYKTIKEYGVKDGLKKVVEDNIEYAKDFLPMNGEPEKYINSIGNITANLASNAYYSAKNDLINTYNQIQDQGIVDYTKNIMENRANQTLNTVKDFISEGPVNYSLQKASEKAKQIAQNQDKYKETANDVMYKVSEYIRNVNK